MSRVWRQSKGWNEGLHPAKGPNANANRNSGRTADMMGSSGQLPRIKVVRSASAGHVRASSDDLYHTRAGPRGSYFNYGDEFGIATDSYGHGRDTDMYSTIGAQFADTSNHHRKHKDSTREVKHSQDSNDVPLNKVKEFCQETGFDGFKHVGNSKSSRSRRIFWTVVVVAAAMGLGYQFVKSAIKYAAFPVNTRYSFVDRKHLDFPAITLCNVNMFRLDHTLKLYGGYHNFLYRGLPQLRQLFPQTGVTYEPMDVPIDEEYPGGVNLREFITINSHRLEDMLFKCTFYGDQCHADNFTTVITNYGVCFTYNGVGTPLQSTNQAGQRKGLSLILNIQHNLYIGAPRESAGFKVLAHPRNELPNMDDHGKELQPGTHVAYGLSITELTKLGWPYGECVADKSFTQNKCIRVCQSRFLSERCGCRTYYMIGNAPYCSPIELIECGQENLDLFNAEQENICKCQLPCKRTLFQASLSQSLFPSYSVPSILRSTQNYHFVALAFGEEVSFASFSNLQDLSDTGIRDLQDGLLNAIDSDGISLVEFTSEKIVLDIITLLINNVYEFMSYDLFDAMGNRLFYDVLSGELGEEYTEYIGLGSEFYSDQFDISYATYVTSGALRKLVQTGIYNSTEGPVDDDYVNQVYERFYFEEGFYEAFNDTFHDVYVLMRTTAVNEVLPNADMTEITADYMRSNILHVDIFYEELKITTIEDQVGYEFFQYLCDVGGALGLFFGASLVSFLEIFDFCCRKKHSVFV